MVQAAKAAGAQVLVVGMQMPPNYGRRYADDFAAVFAAVARGEGAALVPFLLEAWPTAPTRGDVPARPHPSAAAAHPRMLDNVWPVLRPLLR